jgi:hypothetical protein
MSNTVTVSLLICSTEQLDAALWLSMKSLQKITGSIRGVILSKESSFCYYLSATWPMV